MICESELPDWLREALAIAVVCWWVVFGVVFSYNMIFRR